MAADPAVTLVGVRPPVALIVGVVEAAVLMVNGAMLEVEPSGFCTVTNTVPAALNRDEATVAVNCVELINSVVRFAPFHCTLDPEDVDTKLLPVTARVKPEPPTVALEGD